MLREPTQDEIEDWKSNPTTLWWFGKMQDEFNAIAAQRPPIDMTNPGRTAMLAAEAEGLRKGFLWAVNFEPTRGESDA